MTDRPRTTRRQFLAQTAVLAAPGAAASAAGDRIRVGCIGVGARGTVDFRQFLKQPNAQLVAMCDVNEDNLARAVHTANEHYGNGACRGYSNFQEVLEQPGIDAVLIAAPHHWHVPMGVAAAKAGKDIYLEKPMALAMSWCWDLADAVDRYGVLFQFGTQQRSDSRFGYAAQLARSGRLGTIEKVLVLMPGSNGDNPVLAVEKTPSGLDLDAWQGPALAAPYMGSPNTGFRSDRSFGSMSEWGPHMLDMVSWAGVHKPETGLRLEGVARWSGEGGFMDCPTQYSIDFRYGSGVEVDVRSGGLMPGYWRTRYFPDPDVDRRFEHANVVIGSKGWVYVDRESINADPVSLLDDLEVRTDEQSTFYHVRNFLDCVKTRATPAAPMKSALEAELLTHLAYIAVETGEQLEWDHARKRFASSDAANRMLHRAMRSPWRS